VKIKCVPGVSELLPEAKMYRKKKRGTHFFCIKKLFLACFGRISLHDFCKVSGFKGLEKCENSEFCWEIIFVKIKCVPGVSELLPEAKM